MNLSCSCGARFRNTSPEGRHRHNFPLLCLKPKPPLVTVRFAGAEQIEIVAAALANYASLFKRDDPLYNIVNTMTARAIQADERASAAKGSPK